MENELEHLRSELLKYQEAYSDLAHSQAKHEKKLKRLERRLKRTKNQLKLSENLKKLLQKNNEKFLMRTQDFSVSKKPKILNLIKIFNNKKEAHLRNFIGKWFHKVEQIAEYEEFKESSMKNYRMTISQSIAKKFGPMFGGVAEENEENEEELSNCSDIPDEYEEIYVKAHEDLVEQCADAHTLLIKECSARLLVNSLKVLINLGKKTGFEDLKIWTVQSIIEGKGPVNTFEGQGSALNSYTDIENNTKSIRTTLGPSLREAVVGRKTISDRTLVSRFYSKTGENLSQKLGSSSLVQTFLTYMKEQKDSLIIEKQLRIKALIRDSYLKNIGKAWRNWEKVGNKKKEEKNRRFSQGLDAKRRGRSKNLNTEQKAALMQMYKIEDNKVDGLVEFNAKDIGKLLHSGPKLPAKEGKTMAVKILPRASVGGTGKNNGLVVEFGGSLTLKPVLTADELRVAFEGRPNSCVISKQNVPCGNLNLGQTDNHPQPPPGSVNRPPPPPPPSSSNAPPPPPPPGSNAPPPPPPPGSTNRPPPPPPPGSTTAPPPPPGSAINRPPPPPPPGSTNAPPPPGSINRPPPPPPPGSANAPPGSAINRPPPPPPPGSTNAPPPPPGSANRPPPPPPPGSSNRPPPPGAPNAPPPPPGMPNGFATNSAAPQVPIVKPPEDIVTKKLLWEVIPKYKLKTTLWNQGIYTDTKIDFSKLLTVFGEKKVQANNTAAQSNPVAKVQFYITDMKKANNSGIVLSRLSYKYPELIKILNRMQDRKLKSEEITKILSISPKPDELSKLKEYQGTCEELMYSEEFLYKCWVKVPLFQIRLEVIKFKIDFTTDLPEICSTVDSISVSLSSIRNSESFKNFIAVILNIGNYLNHGTNKGNAAGFSLNTLGQLSILKGCDKNKTSLLAYILETLDKPALNFLTEFESCKPASRLEISDLDLKLAELNKGFNLLKNAKESAGKFEGKEFKRFVKYIDEFVENNSDKLSEVNKAVAEVKKLYEQSLELYGEDKNLKLSEFFKKFISFSDTCKRVIEEASVRKGKEEMQKIAAAKKAAMGQALKQEFRKTIRNSVRMSVRNKAAMISKG